MYCLFAVKEEKGLHLYVFRRHSVQTNDEIRIGWYYKQLFVVDPVLVTYVMYNI